MKDQTNIKVLQMTLGFPLKIVIIFFWLNKINQKNYQKGRNRIHTNCWKVDEGKHFLYNTGNFRFYLKQWQHFNKKNQWECFLYQEAGQ